MSSTKRIYVLWACQHAPTDQQIAALPEGATLLFLPDVAPKLLTPLLNSPADEHQLRDLAHELIRAMRGYDIQIVVLPIGSPAFQFILGYELGVGVVQGYISRMPEIWFSHSERKSVEHIRNNGIIEKTSIFSHKKYLKFNVNM